MEMYGAEMRQLLELKSGVVAAKVHFEAIRSLALGIQQSIHMLGLHLGHRVV